MPIAVLPPPRTVLLCEPDAATRELVGLVLARDGVTSTAPALLPAVWTQASTGQPPQVVLFDLCSAGSTATLAAIQAAHTSGWFVVVYSAGARSLAELQHWVQADAYFLAPFACATLTNAVNAAFTPTDGDGFLTTEACAPAVREARAAV